MAEAATVTTIRTPALSYKDLPPEIMERSTWRGVLPVVRTWVLIATCVAAVRVVGGGPIWLAAAAVIGILQHSLLTLTHHAQHYDLSPRRSLNETLGRWTLHAPLLHSLKMMRAIHLRHHATVETDDDLDRFYYDLTLRGRETTAGLIRWTLSMFAGGVILPSIRKTLTGRYEGLAAPQAALPGFERTDLMAIAVTQTFLIAALWLATGRFWAYATLWVLPMLTVGAGLNGLRSALEHADRRVPPHRKLSFRSNPIERFLMGPVNMNYHWEHHRFMAVPFYNLPALRRLCLERGDYEPGRLVSSYWRHFVALCRERQGTPAH